MAFVYLWEYRVEADAVAEFEAAYGPEGAWVELFRRFPGYLRTELLRDLAEPLRYSTIDSWRSKDDYLSFRAAARAEFERLDQECARFTVAETHLGDFSTVEPE